MMIDRRHTTYDGSDAKMDNICGFSPLALRNLRRSRRRGALMLEAILAIGIATSLIGISAAVIRSEQIKQERMLLASEGATILGASRSFISQNYADLQTELFAAAGSGTGGALITISADELVERGYVPPAFIGSGILNKLHGQEYALLVRAVNRADAGSPQATMTLSDLDPSNTGIIDQPLRDRDPSNGEMDIEAILVSYGGEALSRGDGGDIVGRMESSYAGFVTTEGETSGPLANFTLPLDAYVDLGEYPEVGRFASLVALSNFGVLGADGTGDGVQILDPFHRCDDMDLGSVAYAECLDTNEIYTDIVINNHDDNGDGTINVFPAIRGLTEIECGTGTAEGVADSFLIDCALTRMTGDLLVEGDDIQLGSVHIQEDSVAFAGEDIVQRVGTGASAENHLRADRLISNAINGGQDFSEAVIDSRVVFAGETISMPQCPATTLSGQPMEPRIYVTPAAYSDPEGRAIVGVRAYAEPDGMAWRVRLMAFVGQDFCTNTPANAIPSTYTTQSGAPSGAPVAAPGNGVSCSTFAERTETMLNGDITTFFDVVTDRSDGRADVYELDGLSGAVLAQTRCY